MTVFKPHQCLLLFCPRLSELIRMAAPSFGTSQKVKQRKLSPFPSAPAPLTTKPQGGCPSLLSQVILGSAGEPVPWCPQKPSLCESEIFPTLSVCVWRQQSQHRNQIWDRGSSISGGDHNRRKGYNTFTKKLFVGTSLAVQWLGPGAFTAEGTGTIPGWATWRPKKKDCLLIIWNSNITGLTIFYLATPSMGLHLHAYFLRVTDRHYTFRSQSHVPSRKKQQFSFWWDLFFPSGREALIRCFWLHLVMWNFLMWVCLPQESLENWVFQPFITGRIKGYTWLLEDKPPTPTRK